MRSTFIAAIGVSLALTSCSTIQHTASTTDVDTQIYNLTVADLKVAKERATTTAEWKWNPWSRLSLNSQKNTVTARLMQETKSDLIVDPQYTVERRGFMRGGTVTITGYPAKYENFRNMSPDEAKTIATVNGDLTMAVVDPVIATSSSTKKNKKAQRPATLSLSMKEAAAAHKFLSVTIGPSVGIGDYAMQPGFNLGLMYGKMGKHWGWYTKASIHAMKTDDSYNSKSGGGETHYTGGLTFGVMRNIYKGLNFFVGAGVGAYLWEEDYSSGYRYFNSYYDEYYYQSYTEVEGTTAFSIPVEAGFQYNFGKMNILAGVTYYTPVERGGGGNLNPFVGIGFSF